MNCGQLRNSFEQKEVSKNEIILTEGEQAHKYYFV